MTEQKESNPVGQAKALSDAQQIIVVRYLKEQTKHPVRNVCMFLFTVKAGLRAIEVALLEWGMIYDLDGNISKKLIVPPRITKGGKSKKKKRSPPAPRIIPIHRDLMEWLLIHHKEMGADYTRPEQRIFLSQQGYKYDRKKMSSFFWNLYKTLGFHKCSSHSGRRTFITNAARQISRAGGSLLDVQRMAGHRSLATTQLYIEESEEAKERVIDLI